MKMNSALLKVSTRIILGLVLITIGGTLIIWWGIRFDTMLDFYNHEISTVVGIESVVVPSTDAGGSSGYSVTPREARIEKVVSPRIELEKLRMSRFGMIVAYSFRLTCSFILLFVGLVFIRPLKA